MEKITLNKLTIKDAQQLYNKLNNGNIVVIQYNGGIATLQKYLSNHERKHYIQFKNYGEYASKAAQQDFINTLLNVALSGERNQNIKIIVFDNINTYYNAYEQAQYLDALLFV